MTEPHMTRLPGEPHGNGLFTLGGRYVAEEELAQGGMSVVYAGRDTLLDRAVAIKVLRPEPGSTSQAEFLREARAVAALKHPHIVDVYDAGVERDLPYIVMEYVPGETLRDLIAREAPMEPVRAAALIAEIAAALDYAHRRGVVHCDIKPGNVLLPAEDRPKIVDFGIALAGAATSDDDGSIVGTAGYISPEQVEGGAIDGRADVYSLSAVLYEMLTGMPPYEGRDLAEVTAARAEHPPMPPNQRSRAVPRGLSDIVMHGLEPRPEQRYARAGDLASALHEFTEGVTRRMTRRTAPRPGVGAGGDSAAVRAPQMTVTDATVPARRRTSWAPIAVLGALVAALVVAVAILVAGLLGGSSSTVTVPDVVNQRIIDVSDMLHDRGLKTPEDSVQLVPNEAPLGTIIRQEPAPGTTVKRDSDLRLIISRGP